MATTPVVVLTLDAQEYAAGAPMTLICDDNLTTAKRTWKVTDSSGTVWTQESYNQFSGAVYKATAGKTGGTITATLTRTWDGVTDSDTISYSVTAPATEESDKKNIGMSSPSSLWNQRLNEVGADGINSRRIYADLSSSGLSQLSLVQQAVDAGMVPVLSFKVPSFATAGSGGYNTWAAKAAQQLQAFNTKILVGVWHEPYDDMTGPEWIKMQKQLLPAFQGKGELETFCILHGWLLDNKVSSITSFMDPTVFGLLDHFGIDSYQSGSMSSPGDKDLSTRMPTLLGLLEDWGNPDKPVVIGEFNAYTEQSMRNVGETILSTPNVTYALIFNSNSGGKGEPLVPNTGRMDAFKDIKSDSRALQ